jgi:hypothetical protein
MGTPAPDAVKRLVDARDMTALSDRGRCGQISDISDRVPSPADRKVFLSPDYKEKQLRVDFLNGHCLSIRHSDLASAAPVGQRVVRTSPGPYFTALG